MTGLLGVSLCLIDFLADGLTITRDVKGKCLLLSITFLPPMLIVLVKPEIFISALTYAGVFCLYVLIALPIGMYCFGRKRHPSR